MSPNHQTSFTNLPTSLANSSNNPSEKPFLIELWEEHKQAGGHYTPAATLVLTASLRTSGLLRELSPDDCKSLLVLLTFVSPEGHCQPFLSQLTDAMHVVPAKAKARMRRLCDLRWKGEPLVLYSKSASGLSAYSLNPRLVTYKHREEARRHEPAPYAATSREAVIEHSRSHYARPRAEVERMIARQLGQDLDESEDERKVRFRLENAGLTGEQARDALATYPLDTIAQQLDWLPYRHAKNPAGYLLAAIEGGYSEPRAVREERLFRELRYGEVQAENSNSSPEDGEEQEEASPDSFGILSDDTQGEASSHQPLPSNSPFNAEEKSGSALPASDLVTDQEVELPLPEANNMSEDKGEQR